MSCLSCFCFLGKKDESDPGAPPANVETTARALPRPEKPSKFPSGIGNDKEAANNIQAQTFAFRELAAATKNFKQETMLGEGGFGRVYKGKLDKLGQTVAVKQLDRNGMQGNKEFLVEVLMLSLLHHPNLVNLIGYCADGDQRLLVYEFMPLGSLEDHLLDLQPEDTPLNWHTRLKIALGAAKGIEYLHDTANPPVIYRDLKSSNILLDDEYNAKLSDFGLAKLGPQGEKTHVSSRVMGTYGYCAPEYQRTGHLTLKSDIYSYGVVLLEIITGRRAMDPTRKIDEQNLVTWAEPYFKDPSKFPLLADPLLEGNYPVKSLNQVVAIAAMCLQEEASVRPLISDVVTALCYLDLEPYEAPRPPPQPSPVPPEPAQVTPAPPLESSEPAQPELAPILVPPKPALAPTYDLSTQPAQSTPPKVRCQSAPAPAYALFQVDPSPTPSPTPAPAPAPAQKRDDYEREYSMGSYSSGSYTSESESESDGDDRRYEDYEEEMKMEQTSRWQKHNVVEIIGRN